MPGSTVFERFRERFQPPIDPVEQKPDVLVEELKKLANDAKIFTGTQAYEDFRKDLEAAIASCYADPDRGTDVAAAKALKQAGLRESLLLLDRVVRRQEVEDG